MSQRQGAMFLDDEMMAACESLMQRCPERYCSPGTKLQDAGEIILCTLRVAVLSSVSQGPKFVLDPVLKAALDRQAYF